jgi:hypothetical protein
MRSTGDRREAVGMVKRAATREDLPARIRLVRVACFAGPVTVALLAAFVVTGVAGYRGGWLWASAIAAAAMAAVGWWAWGAGRGRVVATITVAVAGMLFGVWSAQEAILSHGRLRSAMDSLALPPTFEHTGDEANGASLCFDECTSFTRHWIAAGDVADVQAQLRQLLASQGFVLEAPGTSRLGRDTVEGRRGRLRIVVGLDQRRAWRDGQLFSLPPGRVGVTATLDTYHGE